MQPMAPSCTQTKPHFAVVLLLFISYLIQHIAASSKTFTSPMHCSSLQCVQKIYINATITSVREIT